MVARLIVLVATITTSASALNSIPLGLHAAASLLEVSLPTPKAVVRAAYRKKAATSHPDVSKQAGATAYFLRLTAAYETLLQFAVTATPSAAASTTTPPPNTATPHASSRPPPSSSAHTRRTSAPGRDAVTFEQQVAAWREFWQTSLQATRLQTEAERKSVEAMTLAAEQDVLRAELSDLVSRGADGVSACRARYARASAQHADATCAAQTLYGRARLLRERADSLQARAQGGDFQA